MPLVRSPEIGQFQVVWQKRLRRPLYDPPPPPDPEPEPPPRRERPRRNRAKTRQRARQVEVQLVGTVLEANHSMAFLMNRDGHVDLKRVGDTLDAPAGARVEQIDRDQVTLVVQGQPLTLKMPEPPKMPEQGIP